MKKCFLIYAIALSLVMWACDVDDDSYQDEPLVIEGWIYTDDFPCVIVSTPIDPTSDDHDLASHVIRWAKVSLSDGDTTVMLTGAVDNTVFPPFSYRSYYMRGVPGKRYTLTVEYHGLEARASAVMPEPAPIKSVEFKPMEGSDTMCTATIAFSTQGFTAPSQFMLLTQVLGLDDRRYPAFMGTLQAAPGLDEVTAAVYRGKQQVDTSRFEPNFPRNSLVQVTLAHINDQAYDYWTSYLDRVSFGGGLFYSATSQLHGNVEGAFGYFTVAGTSTTYVVAIE